MNSRRFVGSILAIFVVASLALAAPQRKTGGSAEGGGPQKEMKAGGKPRVFVATSAPNNESWTNDATRQALEEALVSSGRFEVIAGTQRDNLLAEQGFANSDVVDPNNSVKVGRMLAAKYVVSGTCQSVTTDSTSTGGLGGFGSKIGMGGNKELSSKVTAKVQIQLTDLETGTIVLARSYEEKGGESTLGTKSSDNRQEAAYRDIITRVASRFVGELGDQVPISALVAVVEGGRVALTAGSAAGVKAGMRFEVYAEGDPIKNPATGEILSIKKTRYAVLRVTDVEEKLAWAEIVKTFADNGAEDAAPTPSRIEAQMSAQSMTGGGGGGGGQGQGGGGGKKKKDKESGGN
jgi:curli biogenesis system outer membrane secretion channel CsgG